MNETWSSIKERTQESSPLTTELYTIQSIQSIHAPLVVYRMYVYHDILDQQKMALRTVLSMPGNITPSNAM